MPPCADAGVGELVEECANLLATRGFLRCDFPDSSPICDPWRLTPSFITISTPFLSSRLLHLIPPSLPHAEEFARWILVP